MMTSTLFPHGLLEACRAFKAGDLDRGQYMRDCAARADEYEPWLKAFVYRASPAELAIGAQGPLSGIPVGVKDIIATAGMSTTNGSPIFRNYVPMEDAAIVATIKRLGGTVFGKTVTTEFAFRHPGPTANPWNPAHTPGGSSSGSAAAVGAGIVPLALGTQTMGSIVRPAAYCGVVGFKASFGAVNREGVHPLSASLDHVGFMTRSVDDVAYAYTLLGDPGFGMADGTDLAAFRFDIDAGLAPLASPRLAVVRMPHWERVGAEQNAVLDRTIDTLRKAGAHVEELPLPEVGAPALAALNRILATEAAAIYEGLASRHPDGASAPLKALVAEGKAIPAAEYIGARREQLQWRREISAKLAGFDAILTVPAAGEAPEGLAYTGDASFCAPWTFLGFPALTVPVARSAKGLPLGVQLVGAYGHDIPALRVAKWVETAMGF